jgi:hypothetical protein
MELLLNYDEIYLFVSVVRTYRFVPFYDIKKRILTEQEINIVENTHECLLRVRDANWPTYPTMPEAHLRQVQIIFNDEEIRLWVEMIQSCLSEMDDYDLQVHLGSPILIRQCLHKLTDTY